jgi:hypothetical protein
MPAHHSLQAYLDSYIEAANLRDDGRALLFHSAAGRTGFLTDKSMNRVEAWRMSGAERRPFACRSGSAVIHFGRPGSPPASVLAAH